MGIQEAIQREEAEQEEKKRCIQDKTGVEKAGIDRFQRDEPTNTRPTEPCCLNFFFSSPPCSVVQGPWSICGGGSGVVVGGDWAKHPREALIRAPNEAQDRAGRSSNSMLGVGEGGREKGGRDIGSGSGVGARAQSILTMEN